MYKRQELKTGEEPDDNDLIRRRMVALLVHKANKNDPTIRREAISEEIPACPYRAAQPSRPAGAATVSANPTSAEVEAELKKSDEVRAWVKKLIRNAALSDVEGRWSELEPHQLAAMSDQDLHQLGSEIEAAMRQEAAA